MIDNKDVTSLFRKSLRMLYQKVHLVLSKLKQWMLIRRWISEGVLTSINICKYYDAKAAEKLQPSILWKIL